MLNVLAENKGLLLFIIWNQGSQFVEAEMEKSD